MQIGIIGCGSIGHSLLEAIQSGRADAGARVAVIADLPRQEQRLAELAATFGCRYTTDISSLGQADLDLVIEAAGPAAVRAHAIPLVQAGVDLLLMSVGALADQELFRNLWTVARLTGRRIYLPAGALGGLDAVRSACLAGLDEVTLTTSKPPVALKGAPWFDAHPVDLDNLGQPTLIYEGTAAEAVHWFPANLNVSISLSLAGLGPDRTRVRIIADPQLTVNVHEVFARGAFGELQVTTRNVPSPTNPKTSYLAVLSALAAVKRLQESIWVGA